MLAAINAHINKDGINKFWPAQEGIDDKLGVEQRELSTTPVEQENKSIDKAVLTNNIQNIAHCIHPRIAPLPTGPPSLGAVAHVLLLLIFPKNQ